MFHQQFKNVDAWSSEYLVRSLLAGLLGIALLPAPAFGQNECVPQWDANWSPYADPTLSGSCPANQERCVQIAAQGGSGTVSAPTVTITRGDGTKIKYDANACENPPYQTASWALGNPTTTWGASGCGASPSTGSGATASFLVNTVGVCSVSYTNIATASDPAKSVTNVVSVTFQVWLNVTVAPTITPPIAADFGMPDYSPVSATWTEIHGLFPIYQEHHWLHTDCKYTNVIFSESYTADGSVLPGPCGLLFDRSHNAGQWQVSGSGSFNIGTSGSLGASIGYTFPYTSYTIFTYPAVTHKRHYVQIYLRKVTGKSARLVGTQKWTKDLETSNFIYSAPVDVAVAISGQPCDYNNEVGVCADQDCCE